MADTWASAGKARPRLAARGEAFFLKPPITQADNTSGCLRTAPEKLANSPMLLEGSIQRFSLVDVLQFLAQCKATGVLEVRDFEEYGLIYIVGGRVEGISLPVTDEKLGCRLVKEGCLSEEELGKALLEDSMLTTDQRKRAPLGQRLIEMGAASESNVRRVLEQQTADQVFELAHWQNGAFFYDEPAEMPSFDIAIQANVQELLLDAHRRMAEGEQARKVGGRIDKEVCYGCPLEIDCTPRIKDQYRKKDVCLWRQMRAVVDQHDEETGEVRRLYRSSKDSLKAELDTRLEWD